METLCGRMDCSVNPSRSHTHHSVVLTERKKKGLSERSKEVLFLYDFSFAACQRAYLSLLLTQIERRRFSLLPGFSDISIHRSRTHIHYSRFIHIFLFYSSGDPYRTILVVVDLVLYCNSLEHSPLLDRSLYSQSYNYITFGQHANQ